jgi:RNA polymerase sigma factor (sigma-70 family)
VNVERDSATAGHADTTIPSMEPQECGPLWAAEIARLSRILSPAARDAGSTEVIERLWTVVSLAIRRYLHIHGSRFASVRAEDLEDLGSQKTLELIEKIVSRSWDLTNRSASEIAGYISTSARNALLDHGRRAGRLVRPEDNEWERVMTESTPEPSSGTRHADSVDAEAFSRDLIGCLGHLAPRARLIWFFRAFYDLSSREIAEHARIKLEVGHVDVLMQRTRAAIQQCLRRAGHDTSEIPAGVYARVWDVSRSWDPREGIDAP